MTLALCAAAAAMGCSWILGVSGDPEVVDGPDGADAGMEGAPPGDSSIPPTDAANADEDAGLADDADADAAAAPD